MGHRITVQMFGNFRMEYDGTPIIAEKMHKESQFNRVMQAMAHYGKEGIPKDKLEEMVIGERDIDTPHTALRVIIYKTKQKLAQLGIEGKDLIRQEGGVYYWTKDIEIVEDAGEFEKLVEQIGAIQTNDDETVMEQKLRLCTEAVYLYKGEFLANYVSETWISQEARRYREMFHDLVSDASEILRFKHDWKNLEHLGNYASRVDSLNDWEILTMEAMVESKRYDEASAFYTRVVDYYIKECGMYSSGRLMEVLEKYSNQMNHTYEILENIQEDMDEDGMVKGGYFCSYPVFRGIYQMVHRMKDRTDKSVYLMLCTLVDKNGNQILKESEMKKYSRQMQECIGSSIRKSDVYAKYGRVQFLILMIGISREDCAIVQNRINTTFAQMQPSAGIRYHVNSVICELSTK